MDMPVNSWSRAIVNAEIEKVRHCIIPIIGAKTKATDEKIRPAVVGSAVAFSYRNEKLLVTAYHVLVDNENTALSIFGADRQSRPLYGDFLTSEEHDLAVKVLSKDEVDYLSHIPFLNDPNLKAPTTGERFYASVVGYPATAAKLMDSVTLDTRMEAYSNFANMGADGIISVRFDKKLGAHSEIGHVTPRDQYGKSGGAIFGMRVSGRNVTPGENAKLVGIASRWKAKQKVIDGPSVGLLMRLLDENFIA
jgi:hypothetical protein